MPDYWVFHQPQGIIMRMKRDLSSNTLISRLTASSYYCIAAGTLCPLTRNHIYFGMTGRPGGSESKLLIGYNSNTNTAIYSNNIPKGSWNNPGRGFCMLPTGESFGCLTYQSSAPSGYQKNDWYFYNYEQDTFTFLGQPHDGTTSVGYTIYLLPTGKILSYRSTFGTDGCMQFKYHDFGFTKDQIPENLLYGPYGFNYKY